MCVLPCSCFFFNDTASTWFHTDWHTLSLHDALPISAVNVSQLTGVTDALGGGAGSNPDGSIKAPSYSVAGGTQANVGDALNALDRSEEHTSELQSLMRISYAVICWKTDKRYG